VLFVLCFFVQNEKLAFWREKRKKKVIPKNTIIEALGARGRSSHKSWLFPSQTTGIIKVLFVTRKRWWCAF